MAASISALSCADLIIAGCAPMFSHRWTASGSETLSGITVYPQIGAAVGMPGGDGGDGLGTGVRGGSGGNDGGLSRQLEIGMRSISYIESVPSRRWQS